MPLGTTIFIAQSIPSLLNARATHDFVIRKSYTHRPSGPCVLKLMPSLGKSHNHTAQSKIPRHLTVIQEQLLFEHIEYLRTERRSVARKD